MEGAAMMEMLMALLGSWTGWDGAAFGRGKGEGSVPRCVAWPQFL